MRLRRGLPAFGLLLSISPSARGDDGRPRADRPPGAAQAAPSPSPAFDNALRLARMLGDDRVVARLLADRALAAGATSAQIAEAVEAYEAIGEPESAVLLLERRLRAVPDDDETQVRLAELLARSGQAARAVAVWEAFEARVGILTATQADEFARELGRVGRDADALRVLGAVRADAPADAHAYWDDLATMAWEEEAPDLALAAHRKLWAMRDHRHLIAQRLTALAGEAGAVDEAIGVALDDFHENGEPQSLLQAAELEGEREDWAGARRTLSLVDPTRGPLAQSTDYWLLFAEANRRLGDTAAARAGYRAVLAIDPGSVPAQTALLWDAVEQGDVAALRDDTDRWRASAAREPALWAPFAVALDRLGRTREAIAFYARVVGTPSSDPLLLLEFGDALARVGDARLALRVRRYAVAKLREPALAAARQRTPGADERSLAEQTAEIVRDASGATAGERWFAAITAARGPHDREGDAFVADWCLREDRLDCARRALRAHGQEAGGDARWRGYRLQLALADDDRPAMEALALDPRGTELADRIEALVALERDDAAARAITEGLDRDGLDEPDTWRRRLAEIAARHAPNAGAGGAYAYVGGLDVWGVEATAAHDWQRGRLVYAASGRELAARDGVLAGNPRAFEADAFALGRWSSERGVVEGGLGVNDQPGSLLPRAVFLWERLLTATTGVTLRVSVDEKIDDTALLRLAAAQHRVELGVRQDIGRTAYAQIDVDGREDHTRHFHHLAWDVTEQAEVGYKVVRAEPEWDIGVRALASQRANVGVLPDDIAPLIPPAQRGGDLSDFLSPSYGLVSLVTHLTRGDFLQRYRADRGVFPRYDCSAGVGLLLPDLDGAFEFDCSASVAVRTGGYVSAVGTYEQGVFGIANQTNAQAMVSFTQGF